MTSDPFSDPMAFLLECLERGKRKVFSAVLKVTPDVAAYLLDMNEENRRLRWDSIREYADMMKRGAWRLNGETIIISREGLLNDGQHRLYAVIDAQIGVQMQFTFGVERASRDTLGQGLRRSPADLLTMHGFTQTTKLAPAVRFIWAYDNGHPLSQHPLQPEVPQIAARYPDLLDAYHKVDPFIRQFRLSSGFITGAYYACRRFDQVAAERFIEQLTTGVGIEDARSPILALRRRLQDHLAKRAKLTPTEQAALFIKTFNHVRQGHPVQIIMWKVAETFPRAGERTRFTPSPDRKARAAEVAAEVAP